MFREAVHVDGWNGDFFHPIFEASLIQHRFVIFLKHDQISTKEILFDLDRNILSSDNLV